MTRPAAWIVPAGSSPRMRGTRKELPPALHNARFIPAHAGNTFSLLLTHCVFPVHPRACGEHITGRHGGYWYVGSSPRMRGTPASATRRGAACRFIPAHAGNTQPSRSCWRPHPVHPRACGEHGTRYTEILRAHGSSPRMRGTRGTSGPSRRESRFIPAHAGNTALRRTDRVCVSVHPRACGEHLDALAEKVLVLGSSPRMRGTPSLPSTNLQLQRFIPAHAGNTATASCKTRSKPVHPRACGEHIGTSMTMVSSYGSSPRMRGTQQAHEDRAKDNRFIPAHAGNTPGRMRSRC